MTKQLRRGNEPWPKKWDRIDPDLLSAEESLALQPQIKWTCDDSEAAGNSSLDPSQRSDQQPERPKSEVVIDRSTNYSPAQRTGWAAGKKPAVKDLNRANVVSNEQLLEMLNGRLSARTYGMVVAELTKSGVPGEEPSDTDPLAATVAITQHPLAATLETMALKQRKDALDKHYAARKENTWTMAKSAKPTPEEFLTWLDATFPERREIGMALSDLKHLDKPAYDKVIEWSRNKSKIPEATIEAFGLPTKTTKYDPVRDAKAPTSLAEVYARAERGEDSLKNLNRAFNRAAHHRR
jgi:hypothetical protein